MADLDLNLDNLRINSGRVRGVVSNFARVEQVAGEVANAVGQEQLASKVREFGEKWDITRNKLTTNLTAIADFLDAMVETFRDLDAQQARILAENESVNEQ